MSSPFEFSEVSMLKLNKIYVHYRLRRTCLNRVYTRVCSSVALDTNDECTGKRGSRRYHSNHKFGTLRRIFCCERHAPRPCCQNEPISTWPVASSPKCSPRFPVRICLYRWTGNEGGIRIEHFYTRQYLDFLRIIQIALLRFIDEIGLNT